MQKLFIIPKEQTLFIVGPTAIGKTTLALHLSKVLGGELLSADSRQVYRGMDIITGKDLPKDGTKIWLTDLVDPTEDFSVSQWRKAAVRVLGEVWKRNRLPVVVGGTGFYTKALLDGIETINVPRNEKLRATLIGKSAGELYEILASLDVVRAANMNQSDRRNPRRLTRAIEVARWKLETDKDIDIDKQSLPLRGKGKIEANVLMVGLKAPWEVLKQRIEKRVGKMMKEGALEEIKRLVEAGVPWDAQSITGIGYQKFRDYFAGKITLHGVWEKWARADLQYAKRQMTWFKKDRRIKWFDITKPGWQKKVEKMASNWYNIPK